MGCFSALKPRKRKTTHGSNLSSNQRPPICTERTAVRLPEPDPQQSGPSLQSAPPSFRNRVKAPPFSSIPNRIRALSAPSCIIDDDYSNNINNNNNNNNINNNSCNDCYSNALPLPLPSEAEQQQQQSKGHFGNLANLGSFKGSNVSGPLVGLSGPLPLPPLGGAGLRNFSYDELAAACQNFASCVSEGVYRATFGDDFGAAKRVEATVIRLTNSTQGLREFIKEVNTLSSLSHWNLCGVMGFHAQAGSGERMLLYERLHHGSLHRVLHGGSETGGGGAGAGGGGAGGGGGGGGGGNVSLDWAARMKVALGAAKGLAFLHEEGPFQAMYDEFTTENIQIDKDFTAKLSGYGCVSHNISNTCSASSSPPTEKSPLTPKSNVYSFGIILLELITGRKNLDPRYPKEERNLIKYSKTFLSDDCRLSLLLDPRIKGRFPPKAARIVADLILRCLSKESKERPTMRGIVDLLGNVCDMRFLGRYPLQEPGKIMERLPSGKVMGRNSSFGGGGGAGPRGLGFSSVVVT